MTHVGRLKTTDGVDSERELVGRLRERPAGGLREVLDPILAERDRALTGQISTAAAARLHTYDRLLLTALAMRYDALDRAVRDTTFAVAEIDCKGTIAYANTALIAMLPDAVGREFASLFGARAQDVRDALGSHARQTLRLDLSPEGKEPVHLRGEIGPLAEEHGRTGAYALLLGLDGEAARLKALPDGIVRLDGDMRVAYANPRAEEILDLSSDELRGRPAGALFSWSDAPDTPLEFDERRNATQGWKICAEVRRPHGDGTTPVRIAVTPYFDSAQSRSGFLLTVVPRGQEKVRADLQKALSEPKCEPEELIRAVMRAIKQVVPYDLASFGIYTDDMSYHNTLVVEPQPNWPWTTAWFRLGEASKQFLLSPQTWGPDLQAAATQLEPEIEDDDVFKRIVGLGMKGFVTLPIGGGGQKVRASLTLLSKQAGRYDGHEIGDLRALGVERALLVAEANLSRRRVELAHQLEEQLVAAQGYRELAKALADGIAQCLGWDYVAVFALDRRAELFRMIAEHNGTGSPALAGDYTQPFTEGLLGAGLRANDQQIIADIQAGQQQEYKPVVPGRRSAAALPIRVVRRKAESSPDEIEWIIAIESAQRNAFQGPNMRSLNEALAQCETILRQRWNNSVQTSLLEAVEQALVFVDRAGKIRLTNPRADALFGSRCDQLFGEHLAAFGGSDDDKRTLDSGAITSQERVTLWIDRSRDVMVPTLATQRQVNDDYGHRLWLFTDLREQEYQADWAYLEQTVNEVAQNTRLPLMVASNLVEDAAQHLRGEPATMLRSAVRLLAKADISYERLASTLSARRGPDCPQQIFDAVDVLRQAIYELPEEDLAFCDRSEVDRATQAFLITGWSDQLKFAFRSVLGHLLLRCPPAAKVHIGVDETNDRLLKVELSVAAVVLANAANTRDRIAAAARRAQDAASLAQDAVEAAVRRHHGELLTDHRDGRLTFRFELPRTPLSK
jgi:PAS domain S-box-containing protein